MKLSKREIVMVVILFILAIVLLEFKFVITIGIDNLNDMRTQLSVLEAEQQMMHFNLAGADNSERKRDENLIAIRELSDSFLDSIAPDSLLVFSHERLDGIGFVPFSFVPMPLTTEMLQPTHADITELTYRIKEISRQYRMLNSEDTPDDTSDSGNNVSNSDSFNDVVETYTLKVNAAGTYAQIKALLDEYESLGKQIVFSDLNITPKDTVSGLLNIDFTVNYYGIAKLEGDIDSINDWSRDPIAPVAEDPFALPYPQETEPIEEVEDETPEETQENED